jgi:exosortase
MTSQSPSPSLTLSRRLLVAPAALGVALLWAFWPTLAELARRWSSDPQYSHGYLVPVFAAALLYMRRSMCAQLEPGFHWWGLALLALGLGVRFAGEYLYMDWLEAAALLPCLAGLTVLLGGKPALRWAWPAIAFLAFMVPMPFSVEKALAHPLQRVATVSSTYAMQTLGLPALAEGNVILVGDSRIGVVEACSGLSMLVIFFALSTAVTLLIERPLWEKLVLVASAVPIALVANITRITVTGILHETVGHKVADLVFHDLAGWLMMPYALVLLWLELKILKRAIVEVEVADRTPRAPTGVARAVAGYKSKNRRHGKKAPFFPLLPHGPKKS